MSSAELRLKPNHKIELSHTAGVVQPAGSESKHAPNTRTASQAESPDRRPIMGMLRVAIDFSEVRFE